MIELKYELDLLPMVKNRSIVNILPTSKFLHWKNYVGSENVNCQIESISFLIKDFDYLIDFDEWLIMNYKLMFEIRLNYSCIDKTLWPEVRTLEVFKQWFEIRHSNLILDFEDEPIILI